MAIQILAAEMIPWLGVAVLPPIPSPFVKLLSAKGDPLDLFFWALLLDMILLGT